MVLTNDIIQPSQRYSKVYGTESPYYESRYNEIPDIMNTIQKPSQTYNLPQYTLFL